MDIIINCFIFTEIIFDENFATQPEYLCNKQNSEESEENSDEGDFKKIEGSTDNIENTVDDNIFGDE